MLRTFVHAAVLISMLLSFISSPVSAQSGLPEDGYAPDGDHAIQLSPLDESVFNKKPKFYFTNPYGATEFFIQVWAQGPPFETAYTLQGPGVCNDFYCYLLPTQKLKARTFEYSGEYTWKVQALVGGEWYSYPEQANFTVLSKGFNDTFSTEPLKWHTWNGDWTWNSVKGRMQTSGKIGEYSSLYHEEAFLNYEYTIRMKRKVEDHDISSIVFMGNPDPYQAAGLWNSGVYFSYTNDGEWTFWKVVDGVVPIAPAMNLADSINKFGWNVLKVRVYRPYVDLWINGRYLGWYEVTDVDGEFVGIDMKSTGHTGDTFLVDWATLVPIKFTAFAEHDPAMRLGLDPRPASEAEINGEE